MPISAERMKNYPGGSIRSPEWLAFRASILERAGNRCEGTPQHPDCRAENGKPHPETGGRVVLTIAHMDHDETHADPARCRALCQRCHNRWDAPHRRRNAARTRREKLPQMDLVDRLEATAVQPVRLQLSRRKGFRLQDHSRAVNGLAAVVVSRPGRWGNPFVIGQEFVRPKMTPGGGQIANTVTDATHAVALYRRFTARETAVQIDAFRELCGRNLACWCKPGAPCHADILLDIANRPVCEAVEET